MRLNTLGGVRVIANGAVVTGAAAQPRRLAVLALLARAGRTGVTREKILALLWPDEADSRARRSLNQAVYSLRRDLGADNALVGTKASCGASMNFGDYRLVELVEAAWRRAAPSISVALVTNSASVVLPSNQAAADRS